MLWAVMRLKPHTDDALRAWRKHQRFSIRGGFPAACVMQLPEVESYLSEELGDRDFDVAGGK